MVAFVSQLGQLQRIAQVGVQARQFPRLGDVAVDFAAVNRLNRLAKFRISRRQHSDDARMIFTREAQQFIAVCARHALVGDQHGNLMAALAQHRHAFLH